MTGRAPSSQDSGASRELETGQVRRARHLAGVRYEIRGALARRAHELELQGHEIIKLNIGNLAQFGFRTPETMRLAMIENLAQAEGYCHQKGIFPAREAVVLDTQARGVRGVTAEDVYMGNGVSELILMCMEALLEHGDEVLVPAPDYPLWTAAVARLQRPHMTLAHPRNPKSTDNALSNLSHLPAVTSITFDTIYLIEQEGDEPWKVLRVFRLLG